MKKKSQINSWEEHYLKNKNKNQCLQFNWMADVNERNHDGIDHID